MVNRIEIVFKIDNNKISVYIKESTRLIIFKNAINYFLK